MILAKLKIVGGLRWLFILFLSFLVIYALVAQLSKASVYGILNIFTVDLNEDTSEHGSGTRNPADDNHLLLDDFAQHESELLTTQLKIYFVQTSENDNILSRHTCSIEAAARLHTRGLVFVLMRSRYVDLKVGSFNQLRSYANIRVVHFDEQLIYAGTTLTQLNQTKRTQFFRYFAISHMSDFLRTALLYKYGGIYFDLDVIPLRSFDSFVNTVALESDEGVNVAVLAFEKQHLVLDIQMDIQLQSVKKQFQAFCWNCVGPSALSDALKRVCDDEQLAIHSKDKCQQIDIQPSFVFYPVAYQEIPQFFRRSPSSNNADDLMTNSSIYSIHYFHHMTMKLPIESMSTFARIAQVRCPMVFKQLIDQPSSSSFEQTRASTFVITTLNLILLLLFTFSVFTFVLLLLGTHLSQMMSTRAMILALQHKFYSLL